MIDYKELVKKRWYVQSFNATPIFINMAGVSGVIGLHKNIGYGYHNLIASFQNDFCEWYYDRDDLHEIAHVFEDRIKTNPNHLKEMIQASIKHINELLDFISKHNPSNKISDDELITNYIQLTDLHWKAVSENHVVESYTLTRDIKLKLYLTKELEKKNLKEKFKEYFIILTKSIKMPFVTDYKNNMIKIVKKLGTDNINKKKILKEIKNSVELQELFSKLEKEFYWIRASYKDANSLTKKDFVEEIIHMINEHERSKVITDKSFEKNLKDKNVLIEKLNLSKQLIQMIRLTDTLSWWQDDRKKNILYGCCAIEKYLKEISKRFGHKVRHLKYLLPKEISVDKLKSFNENFFKNRINGCMVLYNKKYDWGYTIIEGKEWNEINNKLKEKETLTEIKEITGLCASLGRTIGVVNICKTTQDIKYFKKNEILVTGMTRPEFVPAMEKAAAIVTDEGGITSHAAIISRELGIPCIIGTKIATRLLKNGQLVEVNANHGVVKLLE